MSQTTTRRAPAPVTPRAIATGLSKHGLVAEALSSDILGGRYKVGDRLPSEPQLSLRFNVSRHTVRTALQSLHRLGLVSSQQGVGTQVQQTRLVRRYTPSFGSAEELLQYATTTRVREIARAEVTVDAPLAARIGCREGEHWWRLRTVRMEPDRRSVVACSEIHIPLAFGSVLDEARRSRQPIFALIEQRFCETIAEIRQDIAFLAQVSPQEAGWLRVPHGAPGMEITRRYLGRQGQVLEFSRSVHPAETFRYSMRLQLQHGSPP